MLSQSAATVAFEGTIASAQRDTLAGQLSIAADAARADCILFDGAAGGPTLERVQEIVGSGKTVILLNPTADQLQQIGKIGGIRIKPPMPAVALSRSPKGHCCLTTFPELDVGTPSGSPQPPDPPSAEARRPVPIGLRLADLLRTRNMLAAIDSPAGLTPPGGAYFGSTTLQQTLTDSSTACIPQDCNENTGQCQTVGALNQITFYVYWVNGASPGYYLIILKQTPSFGGGGSVLNNDDGSKGWMMTDAQVFTWLNAWEGGGPNGYPFSTLSATSPPTSADASEVLASVSQLMSLIVYVPGSRPQSQPFTASDQVALSLPDWAVLDTSAPAGGTAQWFFAETMPWNPATNPDKNNWMNEFFSDGKCAAFSAISQSTLSTTSYAVWTIHDDSDWVQPSAPPVMSAEGSTWVLWHEYLIWAPSQSKSGEYWYYEYPFEKAASFLLQLDTIVTRLP